MLTKSRFTLAAALAAVALGAPPALAGPIDPGTGGKTAGPRQLDMHASTVKPPERGTSDARGEHAASLSDNPAVPAGSSDDRRSPDAVEPFVRPVVVEVGDPVSTGFDWTAAVIGLGAGLALAVLAGVGVAGGRRRHATPRTV